MITSNESQLELESPTKLISLLERHIKITKDVNSVEKEPDTVQILFVSLIDQMVLKLFLLGSLSTKVWKLLTFRIFTTGAPLISLLVLLLFELVQTPLISFASFDS